MSVGSKMDDFEFLIYFAWSLSLAMAGVCLMLIFIIDGLTLIHWGLFVTPILPFIIIDKILDNI